MDESQIRAEISRLESILRQRQIEQEQQTRANISQFINSLSQDQRSKLAKFIDWKFFDAQEFLNIITLVSSLPSNVLTSIKNNIDDLKYILDLSLSYDDKEKGQDSRLDSLISTIKNSLDEIDREYPQVADIVKIVGQYTDNFSVIDNETFYGIAKIVKSTPEAKEFINRFEEMNR